MFRFQFRRMIQSLGFKIAFSFMMGFTMVCLFKQLLDYRHTDISAIPDANVLYCGFGFNDFWTYFTIFFPFVIVLPFATSLITDAQCHVLAPIWVRSSVPRYFVSKLAVSFAGGALVIGVPFLLNLILSNLIFPHNHNVMFGEYAMDNYYGMLTGSSQLYTSLRPGFMHLDLYLASPFLYNVLYLCILTAFAGLMSAVLMGLSFFLKKRKIILFFPFFIFWYLSRNITEFIFSSAVEDTSVIFRNFGFTDYLAPVTFGGQIPYYLLILAVLFLAFIGIALAYALRDPLKYIQEG